MIDGICKTPNQQRALFNKVCSHTIFSVALFIAIPLSPHDRGHGVKLTWPHGETLLRRLSQIPQKHVISVALWASRFCELQDL